MTPFSPSIGRFLTILMLFVSFSIQADDICERSEKVSAVDSDTAKWHPGTIYLVYPDMKFTFKLPREKDRSGVSNLLLKNKETGILHLLDTIKSNAGFHCGARFYNRFLGKYDVILLYNNGKYIIYNDVAFEKNKGIEVDMTSLDTQQSDPESQHWLTLRSFTSSVGEEERTFFNRPVSEKKVRGYVFIEDGHTTDFALVERKSCTVDGYFEIDLGRKKSRTLEFFCIGHNFEHLKVKENSGVFYVLTGPDWEKLKNVSTGPIF
jgi:hypothetical protein